MKTPCFAAWLLAGCQTYDYRLYDHEPDVTTEIGIYIQADDVLVPSAIMHGCRLWSPEGAACRRSPNPNSADIDVYVNDGFGCFTDSGEIVAMSVSGDVIVYSQCLYSVLGEQVSHDELAIVTAHEIGHALGIDHVPLDCEHPERSLNPGDRLPYDRQGRLICGPALMNAEPFMDFTGPIGMTTTDHRAFAARESAYIIY